MNREQLETAGAESTDWEWLHIRGARLGGVTGPTNLVAGTSQANSHMIPYEHQILELSKLANARQPVEVTWWAKYRRRVGTEIGIHWRVPNGLMKKDGAFLRPKDSGEVSFNPVNASVMDRGTRDLAWNGPQFLPPVPQTNWQAMVPPPMNVMPPQQMGPPQMILNPQQHAQQQGTPEPDVKPMEVEEKNW